MKKVVALIILVQLVFKPLNAQVTNTSYVNQYGEKILRLSIVVPANLTTTWELFTTEKGLKKWIAPVAGIDMKTGGVIKSNYDATKSIDDSSSIRLDIINHLEYEMLTLKVNLNNSFSPEAKKEDKHLQEIIKFEKIDENHTKVISSMIGWGKGSHWDKVYGFFERGNDWTFKEILKVFQQ